MELRWIGNLIVLLLVVETHCAATGIDKLSDSINTFGIDMLLNVIAEYDGNIIMSPLSLAAGLNGLMLGSSGSTVMEIANVFHYNSTGMSRTELRETFKSLIEAQRNHGHQFNADFANAFWIKKGVDILPNFTSRLEKHYQSLLSQVDFTQPGAIDAINAWISKETQGTVPRAYKTPLEQSTSVIVTCANYFKGKWATAFESAKTKLEPFYIDGGQKEVMVPMMYVYGNFSYAEDVDTNIKFVEIPFDGGDMAMLILLPNEPDGVMKIKSFTLENIKIALLEMNTMELHLRIPKFNMSYSHDMQHHLMDLGIKQVFVPGQAELSGIDGKNDLSLSQVLEARSIVIDEQGTAPPQVTGEKQKLTPTGYEPSKFDYFTADHPFAFMIRHIPTGVIWYFGRVVSI